MQSVSVAITEVVPLLHSPGMVKAFLTLLMIRYSNIRCVTGKKHLHCTHMHEENVAYAFIL